MTFPLSFVRRVALPVPVEFAYEWHCRPGAFERLSPPWQRVDLLDKGGGIAEGSRVTILLRTGPFSKRWVAEHRRIVPGREFSDVQISGPFARWEHRHSFEPDGNERCVLEDRIDYAVPFSPFGARIGGRFVARELERLFAYRHRVTSAELSWHWKHQGNEAMKILVSGSTGLVGNALVPFLTTGGNEVVRLVRSKSRSPSKELVHWDPDASYVDGPGLEGIDAIVHLAGESIAEGRWTPAKKGRIRDSRVRGTRLLCETLAHLDRPPKVLVCASATGFYGDRGEELLSEASPAGTGYLPDVCREWEEACEPARQKGIRVVNLRIGIVLTPAGGALGKMLTPFKMGVGGVIGNGRQFMSCIAIDDLIGAIHHALVAPELSGPVNAVCPQPVSNGEFTKTLGKVLGRPTLFPVPAFAACLAFGEMAEALLLASTRVVPKKLQGSGFAFRYPTVEAALRHVLGRASA